MTERRENSRLRAPTYQPPEWLADALSMAREAEPFLNLQGDQVSGVFGERCRRSADLAFAIAKLRHERERVGFVPLSLSDYIQGLTKVAGVSLTTVLEQFGIADLAWPHFGTSGAVARLALTLRIGLREILAHVRISYAGQQGFAAVPLLIAHYRSGSTWQSHLEECEAALSHVESEYSSDALQEIYIIESEIRKAYVTREQSS